MWAGTCGDFKRLLTTKRDTIMFIPSLEYRKYNQQQRTEAERQRFLTDLAFKAKAVSKDPRGWREIAAEIVADYEAGVDILDPELFEREDIVAFAEANGVSGDPLVRRFIELSLPRAAWA